MLYYHLSHDLDLYCSFGIERGSLIDFMDFEGCWETARTQELSWKAAYSNVQKQLHNEEKCNS